MKKDYLVLLNQIDGNLASDVSTRCFGRPRRKLSSHQVDSREPSNLSSSIILCSMYIQQHSDLSYSNIIVYFDSEIIAYM